MEKGKVTGMRNRTYRIRDRLFFEMADKSTSSSSSMYVVWPWQIMNTFISSSTMLAYRCALDVYTTHNLQQINHIANPSPTHFFYFPPFLFLFYSSHQTHRFKLCR
jgi:hypothetical protein